MVNSVPTVFFMVFRIVVACICGGVIGLERTKRLKEAASARIALSQPVQLC